MSTQHTPHPWFIWNTRGESTKVGPSPNCTVASMFHPPVGSKEANARLIAAAPEQHDLLQTFTEWARQIAGREELPTGIRTAAANLHDDGKRLIAKATGAEQTHPQDQGASNGL